MIKTIPYSTVGTVISNRRNMSQFTKMLGKAESEFRNNLIETIVVCWMDSREVVIVSNCHSNDLIIVKRKQKDYEKKMVSCPAAHTVLQFNDGRY